ncbi:MAG: GAF domain-containing protein [Gammaproteobacteria bacterium]|nr:GAF domain-containing protein [Gammaproteobacteria bacterium]
MKPAEIEEKIAKLKEKGKFVDETWANTGNRELLKFVVELGTRLFNCERVSIFLLDPDDNSVWLVCGTGLKERAVHVPKSNSLVGQVIHGGRLLTKTDMEHQHGAHEQIDHQTGFTSRNAMAAPIYDNSGNKVIGSLELLNKRGGGMFDDEDRRYVELVTNFIDKHLANLFLRQELVKISREIQIKIKKLEKML